MAAAVSALVLPGSTHAQEDMAAFYKGRSINMYIGAAVGGGYDAYARLLGRHIGKYIPGNPNVIAINMPGASGNTVVAHIYNLPKDATTIAQIPPGAITSRSTPSATRSATTSRSSSISAAPIPRLISAGRAPTRR
jgi:tripartite-type tricarboxylate transporter receptor subunit TctC